MAYYFGRRRAIAGSLAAAPQHAHSLPGYHGGYVALWQDCGQGGEILRRVHSQSIRETWTQHDPELVEREYLPKERRKELRSVKATRLAANATTPRPPAPAHTPVTESAADVAVVAR